jgi:hypothetical protein
MNLAQSSHIPAPGAKPGWSDLPWLIAYAGRGLTELVRARLIFAMMEARDIPQRNRTARERARLGAVLAPATTARMAYVLPRLSARLPWRSDCLIQAIAAQNWLMAHGRASEIQIGVEHPVGGEFGAHAWLLCDGEVVTGGDIDRYQVLLSDSPPGRDSDAGPGPGVAD